MLNALISIAIWVTLVLAYGFVVDVINYRKDEKEANR